MRICLVASIALLSVACGEKPEEEEEAPQVGTVFLWIGADKDSFTRCTVASSCADGGMNHALEGSLQLASKSELELERAYLHFPMPELPEGATVVRAHLEVYNADERIDGKSDDLCLGIHQLESSWSPLDLTWTNQPIDAALTGDFGLSFRSSAWTTGDVTAAVQQHFADPSTNHGFAITAPPSSEIQKGFLSLNTDSRTTDDLGRGPRLLIEIELPAGSDPIVWPEQVAVDSDLLPGDDVLIANVEVGEDFPEEWEPAISEDRCN